MPTHSAAKTASRGITLIELMIVVVVIGILAAIAYPSYQNQVRKSRRSDGKTTIQQLAARLEQFYTDNKSYDTTDVSRLGYAAPIRIAADTIASNEGYYVVKINAATSACPITTCYALSATATSKGAQNQDTGCSPLTFNSLGTKAPNGCW